jgi:hypothetical protein
MTKARIIMILIMLVIATLTGLAWKRGHDIRTGDRQPVRAAPVGVGVMR